MTAPEGKPLVSTLSRDEMKSRALAFAKRWAGAQREEAEAKTFLDEFFTVFGRDRRAIDARHEYRVEREGQGEARIDLLWPGKLLVEMKSTGKDLSDQKGGAARQAFDYLDHLDPEVRPRWVIVSDFAHFVVYDLGEEIHDYLKGLTSTRRHRPEIVAQFPLRDLPDKLRHFAFIRDEEQHLFQTQPDVNLKAVKLLADFHDQLKGCGYSGHDLERFLVRVLFCLFAEDTDIFPWNSFTRVVERSNKSGSDLGLRLAKLFETLNNAPPTRQTSLAEEFALFPYVNGGLFAERLSIADFTTANRAALLACCRFDWSRISPSIFGSLFQGVMEPAERRKLGAHYTSEENIRRVIDPLFLDELKAEFARLRAGVGKRKALEAFHQKLATLRFLDPACGCGNFLVVAYRELRALELAVLQEIYGNQLALDLDIGDIVRVNVDQFYGIEIEEFPALIAETAMWLTDHQVNVAVSKAFGRHFVRIPLVKSATIKHGNALRLDWWTLLLPEQCSYIFGNPPFIGHQWRSDEQQKDMALVWGDDGRFGRLDYVTAWYRKAADYIHLSPIRCAFVSTNSISQGEQVGILWSDLFARGIKIHFAHRTFVWDNEASGKAHVHVVIIGFGAFATATRRLFDYDDNGKQSESSGTANLSPYLIVGPDLVLPSRTDPRPGFPQMKKGSQPTDGGHLIMDEAARAALVAAEPAAAEWIRPFIGGEEFINGTQRWCLWLKNVSAAALRRCPAVMERVKQVRESRLKSPTKSVRDFAERPTLFTQDRQPNEHYLAVPEVSSENRRYIPIGFLPPSVVGSNKLQMIVGGTVFHFGVLSSAIHMAWVRVVAGRLESRLSYAPNVYNTFPWPEPDAKQRAAIETAAQAVLDARAPHLARGASLADLYDPLAMPAELLKAHHALDHAVDRAYRTAPFTSERERVEFLFALYEKLTAPLAPAAKPAKRPRAKKSAVYHPQAEADAAHHFFAKEDPAAT